MRRVSAWGTGLALLLALAGTAAADEAKQHCKQGCQEELRSCKSGCQLVRDSGDQQESQSYADCDSECHERYDSCKDDCEGDD